MGRISIGTVVGTLGLAAAVLVVSLVYAEVQDPTDFAQAAPSLDVFLKAAFAATTLVAAWRTASATGELAADAAVGTAVIALAGATVLGFGGWGPPVALPVLLGARWFRRPPSGAVGASSEAPPADV